jgi:flap endonuclease-1
MEGKGDVDGVVSQDFDCLLFGARKIYRNITVSGKRKIPGKNIYIDVEPEMIDSQETLEELGFDRRKLVWLSILIGTDFNEKFPKIGPKTALKLVKEFDSFEEITKETGYEPDFDYKEVEKIFLEPHVAEDYKVEFGAPDHEKVQEFLCERHDFSKDRVANALKKLEKILDEKGQQSRLDNWF